LARWPGASAAGTRVRTPARSDPQRCTSARRCIQITAELGLPVVANQPRNAGTLGITRLRTSGISEDVAIACGCPPSVITPGAHLVGRSRDDSLLQQAITVIGLDTCPVSDPSFPKLTH
jgi:hypothetical protein